MNVDTGRSGAQRVFTVNYPNTDLRVDGLDAGTIYNITIQPGTEDGKYCAHGTTLWGAYSTLDPGVDHILRLKARTTSMLHVSWEPRWGLDHGGYRVRSIGRSFAIGSIIITINW